LIKNSIRILLGDTRLAPYDEAAPGDMLSTFNTAVLGQLLDYNTSLEITSGFLKSWSWDASTSQYELILKEELQFHNGRKVTAYDLEFTLLRGFFTKHRSFYNIYLNNIAGIENIKPNEKFRSGGVAGVKITGPMTITVKLKTPNPTFLFVLTRPYFSLVPREELNDDLISWRSMPIGAGDFKVINKFENGKVVVKKVADSDSSMLIELYTHADDAVDYDISIFDGQGFDFKNYEKVESKFAYTNWSLLFHNNSALGGNSSFKKALSFAIDRSQLLKALPECSPASEMLPKYYWGRSNLEEAFSLSKAKKFLNSLPAELLSKVWQVPVFTGRVVTSSLSVRLGRLKAQLQNVGLNVEFFTSTEKFLSENVACETPFTVMGTIINMVDPLLMFAQFKKDSAFKYERPNEDLEFEKLYIEAARALSEDERIKTLRNLSRHVNDSNFFIPLAEIKSQYLFNNETIAGLGEQTRAGTLYLDKIKFGNW
jgi:ABC-type transport system substrate-binding protein